jgi:site-specific recombinase XerD
MGKGGQVRHCPLWKATAESLEPLVAHRRPDEPVFYNRRQQPLTRFGIYALVQRAVTVACQRVPSLRTKTISPHSIRHTSAVHLLRAGVDINTIRAWLGHVSLDTTHIYAEVDLEMKAKALAHCEVSLSSDLKNQPVWREDRTLMAFLRGL